MKKISILSFIIVFSFILVAAGNISAASEPLSNERRENIEENCSSIKQTLKRVQNSDRNARVSIGRSFQIILTDYITPLNVRLVKNNRFNNDLADLQYDFAEARDEFNHKYVEYSQELEILISMNCNENQDDFYSRLESTRNKRSEVITAMKKLDSIIDSHIEEVKTLYSTKKVQE